MSICLFICVCASECVCILYMSIYKKYLYMSEHIFCVASHRYRAVYNKRTQH